MPTGDGFTPSERQEVDRAIRDAEMVCRFEFSVYVGPSGDSPRAFAEDLHAKLVAPAMSVLLLVDPGGRKLEVVTGSEVHRELTDDEVRLAVLQMQSAFADGDLVGGIVRGVHMLAEHARRPPTLHAEGNRP